MPTLFKMRSLVSSFSVGVPQFPVSNSPVPPAPLHLLRVPPLSVTRGSGSCLMGSIPRNSPVLAPRRCSLSEAAAYGGGTSADGTAQRQGEIHVIVGPMFAGKTTALLRRLQTESSNGRKIAVIKSDKDNRYGSSSIVTHDGLKMPCWALPNLAAFREAVGAEAYDQLDVVGIDEAQFFEDLYEFCRSAADIDGKAVIVAGLDGDYLRRSFGSVIDIVPLADSVTKLTAQCDVCGNHASFTLRKTEETEKEVIGGKDVYMPVCRQHYVSGQAVIEAARLVLKSRRTQQSCHVEAASVAK